MAIKDEIKFFKEQFAADIAPALAGTPLSIDLMCAIAFQETGELWSKLRLHLQREEILRLCVGDTLDRNSGFLKNKATLIAVEDGQRMFDLAHQLLIEMGDATGIEAYQRLGRNPNKFVHGYGIFQSDLQFFRDEPDFFLEQRWTNFDICLDRAMKELKEALKDLRFANKTSLTDLEAAFVAIVYNTGFRNFKASKGLQQGHFDGKHFYGENIVQFVEIARTIPMPTPGVARVRAEHPMAPTIAPAAPRGVTTPTAARVPLIVAIAKAEFAQFHGIDEGTQPLRGRIADYYEAGGGSRDLDPTLNDNAWSAAFVSFCVKQSGATADQFRFSLSHSVFVHAAIANADANRGVFRGHRITEYAPKLGDLIHHNRDGASLGFDFARANTGYPSHSAIVVDFEVRNGVRGAVTIGGNEGLAGGSGTVGEKFFALDSNGFLDQSKIRPRLICVVENLLAAGTTVSVMPLGPHVVNVRTDLKLRGGPGPEFSVIKSLANGTKLNVLEFTDAPSGRWAIVDLEGDGVKDGFVFAKFIDPVTS